MLVSNTIPAIVAFILFCICVWMVTLYCPNRQNIVMSNVQVNVVRHYVDTKKSNASRKMAAYKQVRAPLLVPKYMLDLYTNSKSESRIMNGPDIVKGVTPTSKALVFADTYNPYMKKEQVILVFEVPPTNAGEILKGAELRLLINAEKSGNPEADQENPPFEVLWIKENTKETKNLDSCSLSQSTEEWLSCNITLAFQQEEISILTLVVKLKNDADIQLNYDYNIRSDEPLLILSYETEKVTRHSPMRTKRNVEEYEEVTNKVWDTENVVQEMPAHRSKRVKNTCRRRPLYVDFSQINYDSWIVAPEGYEAFQCAGKCFFPVSEHLSPTKHAIIQTLLHSVTPEKAPRACCVPTRLEPISLLYVDQHGVLTYRFSYEDMVVAECGCR